MDFKFYFYNYIFICSTSLSDDSGFLDVYYCFIITVIISFKTRYYQEDSRFYSLLIFYIKIVFNVIL